MNYINAKDLYYGYNDDKIILKDINIDIKKGEFVAIIGVNGSGKSTLSYVLAGLNNVKNGKVLICGLENNDDNYISIRKKCGIVFQNPDNQLVATIVEEDVAFGPENLGKKSEEINMIVENSLKKVRMEEHRYEMVNNLSGGQKQRVAIAGILAMNPECVILDEPTSMLDPKSRREIIECISYLNKSGITVILITHFLEELENVDRCFVLKNGEIIVSGKKEDVFSCIDKISDAGLKLPPYMLMAKKLGINKPIFSKKVLLEEIDYIIKNKN